MGVGVWFSGFCGGMEQSGGEFSWILFGGWWGWLGWLLGDLDWCWRDLWDWWVVVVAVIFWCCRWAGWLSGPS